MLLILNHLYSWSEVRKYSAMAGPESSPADRSYYALASKLRENPDASTRKLFTYVDQDEFCDDYRRKTLADDFPSG